MKARINPNTKLVLPELSYTIMGILFTVHNELGPLILEKYYQRAVAKELSSERLKFTREIRVIHKLDSSLADALDMRLSIRFIPK